jgi:hypothetical protein
MKSRFINKILVAVAFMATSLSVWAEALPTPSPSYFPSNPNGGQDEPVDTPIDQITIWLTAAGVLLAAYYLMKFRSLVFCLV